MATPIKIELILDANGVVQGIKTTGSEFVQLGSTIEGASKKANKFSQVLGVLLGGLAINSIGQFIGALQRGASSVVEFGTQVQDQLADLSAITGIAGDDLERLGNTAVTESMRTGVAATQQIEAYKLLASNIEITAAIGVAGLERLGREVVTLAQASKVDLALAANVVAGSVNAFGLAASDSTRVVNALAAGAKFGAAEVADLSLSLKNSSASAAGANVSLEETVGAIEVLSQNFVKGGEAGTGLRNVITILQTETAKLGKAGIHGLSIENDGLAKTLARLKPLLSDAAALADIFGRENVNTARILITNANAVATMTDRITGTNTATEQAAIQTQTFSGAMARLSATVEGIGVGAFQQYQGELVDVVETVISAINYLRDNSETIANLAKVVVAGAAAWTAYTIALNAGTIATKLATIAQQLFNYAIKKNPIGFLLTVLVALGTYLYTIRDRVADLGAKIVQFAISSIRAFDSLANALGFDWLHSMADGAIVALEGIQKKLSSYAEETRHAKDANVEFTASQQEQVNTTTAVETATVKATKSIDELKSALVAVDQLQRQMAANPVDLYHTDSQGNSPQLQAEIQASLGEPLKIIEPDTLANVGQLLDLFTRMREVASTQEARDQIAQEIQSLEDLKATMEGVKTKAQEIADAKRLANQQALMSTIQTAAREAKTLQDVGRAALGAAKQIVEAELMKAIAKAIATIPFPANLIVGAAAGAGLSALFHSIIPGFARGGLVGGTGGTDNQLARVTPGEYIVNPQATASNMQLLRAINSGQQPATTVNVRVSGVIRADRRELVATIEEEQTIINRVRGGI